MAMTMETLLPIVDMATVLRARHTGRPLRCASRPTAHVTAVLPTGSPRSMISGTNLPKRGRRR